MYYVMMKCINPYTLTVRLTMQKYDYCTMYNISTFILHHYYLICSTELYPNQISNPARKPGSTIDTDDIIIFRISHHQPYIIYFIPTTLCQ